MTTLPDSADVNSGDAIQPQQRLEGAEVLRMARSCQREHIRILVIQAIDARPDGDGLFLDPIVVISDCPDRLAEEQRAPGPLKARTFP